jgi:hypothetical protein
MDAMANFMDAATTPTVMLHAALTASDMPELIYVDD